MEGCSSSVEAFLLTEDLSRSSFCTNGWLPDGHDIDDRRIIYGEEADREVRNASVEKKILEESVQERSEYPSGEFSPRNEITIAEDSCM